MFSSKALGLTAALGFCAAAAQGSVIQGPFLNPQNNHTYYLLSQNSWAVSESEAVALGGHLATINNDAENTFVYNAFQPAGAPRRLLWIGYTAVGTGNDFAWVNGENSAFTNWAPGEPNSLNNNEDFVALYYNGHSQGGRWNDWNDRVADPIGLPFHGVVEVVPEPASLGLLGLAGVSLLARRRGTR